MAQLEAFGEQIWTVSTPLRLAGTEFGTRMTVVQLTGGGTMLIAPCPIDDDLAAEIAAFGPVQAIVAPNCFHHFYVLAAHARYPEAEVWLADGVAAKLASVPADSKTLGAEPSPLWSKDLEQIQIEGAPRVNEVVFYHARSKTLVLTDLCFHFDPAPTGWGGLFLRLAGAHGKLAVSRLMRSQLKDRPAVRSAIAKMLDWDFDRLIVTHGQNIGGGAKARLREATADL